VEQIQDRSDKFRAVFLILTVLLLIPTALGLLPNGKPTAGLVNLGSVFHELPEDPQQSVYSSNGRTLGIIQSQKSKLWSLLLLDGNLPNPALQVPGGTKPFRAFFINKGTALVADFTVNEARNLYRIDTATGQPQILTRNGILPLEDGVPWSEETVRMLVTVQKGGDYEIQALNPAQPDKVETLVKESHPVRCPSWIRQGRGICWVGGPADMPAIYSMDLAEKKVSILARPTVPEQETVLSPEGEKALAQIGEKLKLDIAPKKGKDMARITWASPSPNDYMILYSVKSGKDTTLWSVLLDGDKNKPVYTTKSEVNYPSWNTLGNQVVFEEKLPWGSHFFYNILKPSVRNVRLLDVNLGTSSTLVMPQLDHYGPAFSPDGVKVAFLGTKNLWFPTWLNKAGVWVAVLR
jgi:hypothetical protein